MFSLFLLGKNQVFCKKTIGGCAKMHFCYTIARSANGNCVAFYYALYFATQNALATPITFGINLLRKNVFSAFF